MERKKAIKKLTVCYGGVDKTFKHLKDVENSLKQAVVNGDIRKHECANRIFIIKNFKKRLQQLAHSTERDSL